jgi:hypothetical protein
MGALPDNKAPTDEAVAQGVSTGEPTGGPTGEPTGGETRWLDVLEEVVEEQETGRPWWQNVGIFLAWAAGIALAAGLVATIILGIVELFKGGRQFIGRTLSDYIFWASALLMIAGFLMPTSVNPEGGTGKKAEKKAESREERTTTMLRRRMRRMYDPWRWRLWAGAALCFGLSALVGLTALS